MLEDEKKNSLRRRKSREEKKKKFKKWNEMKSGRICEAARKL